MTALLALLVPVVAEVGRTRGFFFLSRHPWVLVVLLLVVVALVLYTNRRNNRR